MSYNSFAQYRYNIKEKVARDFTKKKIMFDVLIFALEIDVVAYFCSCYLEFYDCHRKFSWSNILERCFGSSVYHTFVLSQLR